MANLLEQLDQSLANLFADWSLLTTLLALLILALVAIPILYPSEPDTHPLLLARQAQPAPIRNKYESALYRSPEVLYGNPLRSGLNVKDVGSPRWASGKDGDLRDVWREVQKGGQTGEDGKTIPKAAIMTIYGKEDVVEHEIEGWSREIAIIGQHLKEKTGAGKKVAIYLPNSVEYLSTIFACAFYGLTPILLPYNQPHPKVYELLNATSADALICSAGSLPLDDLARQCPNLRLLTWVVEKSSQHMDFNGPSSGGDLSVSVWHDVVSASAQYPNSLPNNAEGDKSGDMVVVWQPTSSATAKPDIVTFTQSNLVAAIAALISALPLRQRFTPSDLVLPADTFTHSYILCLTFGALYTHANLAINSVAQPGVNLTLASRAIQPTVILASAETLASLHAAEAATPPSMLRSVARYIRGQALAAGRMPTSSFLSSAGPSSLSSSIPSLRLIMTSARLNDGSPPLSSSQLHDIRLSTGARIVYALIASRVAGAVAQTSVFDYRLDASGGKHAHFGMPLSCVEIKLRSGKDAGGDDVVAGSRPEGEIVVRGNSVAGTAEVGLGVKGRFREDGVLEVVD